MSVWSVLEQIPGLIALPVTWKKRIGDQFEQFRALCLEPSPIPALSFPCPLESSCALSVKKSSSSSSSSSCSILTGVCRSNPARCPLTEFTLHDITPLQLNWPKLGRAISRALNLESKAAPINVPHTLQIGSWSADAVPVFLTIQTERHHLHFAICDLIIRLRQKIIILTPTNKHFDATSQELLAAANSAIFPLDTTAMLTDEGVLQPLIRPGDLFARFIPEQKLPEDAALRAFAIIKSLDSNPALREAPVFTVFCLYCVECLSIQQIAKKLNCSIATISNRLRLIREKTGADPKTLRAYSTQFTQIEDSLSDPRARKIHRQTAMDAAPPADEE